MVKEVVGNEVVSHDINSYDRFVPNEDALDIWDLWGTCIERAIERKEQWNCFAH